MLKFALPEVLFKFQYHKPVFEPLFQFPPTTRKQHRLRTSNPLEAGHLQTSTGLVLEDESQR